jgi:site-specific DNA recombinase
LPAPIKPRRASGRDEPLARTRGRLGHSLGSGRNQDAAERGEDRSRRRSNPSEYLLSGRLRCGRCGQAYVGTAAHGRSGRSGRYSYYTCFTRTRYGTDKCNNDRLTQRDETHQSELEVVQRKLDQTRAAIDRYLNAFENATMPEDACATRLAALTEQAKALEANAANLAAQDADETPERVTQADIAELRERLQAAIRVATPARLKPILQALTHEIRIDSRQNIEPIFQIPAVRIDDGYMEPAGIEPATSCLQSRRSPS